MDNEEAIKLTPAEKQIVNAIARDNNINVPLTDQQKEKINKLAQALSAERGKAAQLARDLELARSQMKTKADKSARNDKKQAEALARTQKALEQKNIQVEELTRQMEELKSRSAEQATPGRHLRRNHYSGPGKSAEPEHGSHGTPEAGGGSPGARRRRSLRQKTLCRRGTTVPDFAGLPAGPRSAWVNLGTILLQRNKAEEAIKFLKKATELDASSSPHGS